MYVSSLELLEQGFLWLWKHMVAAGWKGHFLSQSKEKEICTLRKGEETKPSKLRAERGRNQLQRFWLKLFLRISRVWVFPALILTHVAAVCKNLSLSVSVEFLSCFGLTVCFGLNSFIITIYQSLLIMQKKCFAHSNCCVEVSLLPGCNCWQNPGGTFGCLPWGDSSRLLPGFRYRAGIFLWGSGMCLCSPVSSSKGSGMCFKNCCTSPGNQRPWNPPEISERTGRFLGVKGSSAPCRTLSKGQIEYQNSLSSRV